MLLMILQVEMGCIMLYNDTLMDIIKTENKRDWEEVKFIVSRTTSESRAV